VRKRYGTGTRIPLDVYGLLPRSIIWSYTTRSTTTSTTRLEARISRELHDTLKRAAALQNRTITDFAIAAVQEAAENAIEQAEVVRLSLADQTAFAEALLSSLATTPALERAFNRHRKLVTTDEWRALSGGPSRPHSGSQGVSNRLRAIGPLLQRTSHPGYAAPSPSKASYAYFGFTMR